MARKTAVASKKFEEGQTQIRPKKEVDKDVLTLSRERIAYAFERFDTVAVSFSGGKDSTVCLNLVVEVARELGRTPVPITHFDEEAIPYETEDYVRRTIAEFGDDIDLRWMCLPVKHRNACSRKQPFWYPWAPEDRDKWVRELPAEAITEWPGFVAEPPNERMSIPDMDALMYPVEKYGTVGIVMGIRGAESLTRERAVRMRTVDNYIIKSTPSLAWRKRQVWGHCFKVYPIYDWRTEDVWTAPARLGWDYNHAYDALEMAGIKPHAQRCAPPFGEEPIQKLWQFAVCFPDIWDRMQQRVHGAATAARYSTTELYEYRTKPQKPADMKWTDFILHYLQKHDEGTRKVIAWRLKKDIERHHAYTTDPILEKNAHPQTGMSWNHLITIASRGDLKERRAMARPPTHKQPAMWEKYNAEKAEYEATGRDFDY